MNEGTKQPPKRVYLAAVIVIFFCTLSTADSIGFVPCSIDGTCAEASEITISDLPELGLPAQAGEEGAVVTPEVKSQEPIALPSRIRIAAIDLDLPVQNPSTRDIAALDTLLQKGPARYVDSSKLGGDGSVIIFAHSSHLPVVHNQMYKAFNRIPELAAGDSITLEGDGRTYLYTVTGVREADINDSIPLSGAGKKLILVTCDTLTGKSARFVLEADYTGIIGQ